MKIKYISLCSLIAYSTAIFCAQYNIPQLLSEFNKVGTFKPQAPNEFNEQRAWEIVRLMEKAQPTRARQLELDLRRSLDIRSGTQATSNAELLRLQQENEQLRNRTRNLEEENEQLRNRRPATDDCQEQLRACRERMEQFGQLASRTISGLNDFERAILAAAHELDISPVWGFSTPENREQRLASARLFIEAARTQVQGLSGLRDSLERLFSTAP